MLTVDVFSVYLLSRVDMVIRYIEVYFTFGLPDYVRYIEEFVINPFSAKDVLIDFTLSNARRFYSSKGNPLAVKGLKNSPLNIDVRHIEILFHTFYCNFGRDVEYRSLYRGLR